MSRIRYLPLIQNDNAMKNAVASELSIDENNGNLYVYDDYKIPISKTEELDELIKLEKYEGQLSHIENDIDKIDNLEEKWNDIEDLLFGRYYYDYNKDKFDYEGIKYKAIDSVIDKIEKMYDNAFFLWEKTDYLRDVYEYNKFLLNILEETLNGIKLRTKFLFDKLKDLERRYELVRPFLINIDFFIDMQDKIGKIDIEIDDINHELPDKTYIHPGDTENKAKVETDIDVEIKYYEYGFFRWLSNNKRTYPTSLNVPWQNFNSSKPFNDGKYHYYDTRVCGVWDGSHWYLPHQGKLPSDVTFAGQEWKEIHPSNMGKKYPDYKPELDRPSKVESGWYVPTIKTSSKDQSFKYYKAGKVRWHRGFYSSKALGGIFNAYGKSVRIKWQRKKRIKKKEVEIIYS